MKSILICLSCAGLFLTGCTVAYNVQTVGDGPQDVPENSAMTRIVGEEVLVTHQNGTVVEGIARASAGDSLFLDTGLGAFSLPRRGLVSVTAGGSIAGNIVGFVLGLAGGVVLGGLLGAEIGATGKKGWDHLGGSLEGGFWGILLGGVAGSWGGSALGRQASAGTIYTWPAEPPAEAP